MLLNQNSFSLHHPAYHTFERRRIEIHSIDNQWQADLVYWHKSENNSLNYILIVIDGLVNGDCCIPLKD